MSKENVEWDALEADERSFKRWTLVAAMLVICILAIAAAISPGAGQAGGTAEPASLWWTLLVLLT